MPLARPRGQAHSRVPAHTLGPGEAASRLTAARGSRDFRNVLLGHHSRRPREPPRPSSVEGHRVPADGCRRLCGPSAQGTPPAVPRCSPQSRAPATDHEAAVKSALAPASALGDSELELGLAAPLLREMSEGVLAPTVSTDAGERRRPFTSGKCPPGFSLSFGVRATGALPTAPWRLPSLAEAPPEDGGHSAHP